MGFVFFGGNFVTPISTLANNKQPLPTNSTTPKLTLKVSLY